MIHIKDIVLISVLLTYPAKVNSTPSANKKTDGVCYEVAQSAQPSILRSIGAELDPHFHAQHVIRSKGAKEEDWEKIVVPRVKKMKLQSFRIMVLPNWYEPHNDDNNPNHINPEGFDFETLEMKGLYKALDLAEEMNAKVTIVPWGACCNTFLSPGTSGWVTAPTNQDEFAENISALLNHLINVKRYTCIDELTPGNEPDGWGMTAKNYVEMCRIIHNRLTKDGLRTKIKLALVDNTDRGGKHEYIQECAQGLNGIADVLVSHTYIFGYETSSNNVVEWEKKNCKISKKYGIPHFVGEFGSNLCIGSSRQKDIDWYQRGILVVRNALAILASGASGISYWQLFDEYYSKNDAYAQMQQLGMWRSVKEDYVSENYYHSLKTDYQPRPQYYAYSLLSRNIRPGANIYNMTCTSLDSLSMNSQILAANNTDGTWVYVIANLHNKNVDISLSNKICKINGEYQKYVYEENSLPLDDEMIDAEKTSTKPKAGNLRIKVKANSVVLIKSAI